MAVSEHRTQIYLPNELHHRLKVYAQARGLSVAQVVRQCIEQVLDEPDYETDPIMRIVGIGKSQRKGDVARRHDDYLYGIRSHGRSK